MSARLTINVDAVRQNWQILHRRAAKAQCAAVLKANAYGLGLEPIALALSHDVESFFVALPEEGRALRRLLPHKKIFILHGMFSDLNDMVKYRLIPVLNTCRQVIKWRDFCKARGVHYAAALQIDSGMRRFGLSENDLKTLDLEGFHPNVILSHLACADEAHAPSNEEQYRCFLKLTEKFPEIPKSLSASSGIFLGEKYHFDLVRPGAALYGISPRRDLKEILRPVVALDVQILQLRKINAGEEIGYGLAWKAPEDKHIAVVELGYADGFFRSNSGKISFYWEGIRLPVIGRVSMDSLFVDVSDISEKDLHEDMWLSVIGPHQTLDDVAECAGTIGYEILTALGHRYERVYHSS